MDHLVAPSILTADFSQLEKVITMLNQSQADWIHIDVMDGVFVPNITFGFQVIRTIRKLAQKPLDVHLMIIQPERYIREFKEAGADLLCVHYEASVHLHRTIQMIRDAGMRPAVALNPGTPVSVLENILHDLDMVLIMTVNPGFGAQKFIGKSYDKITALNQMIREQKPEILIEVDGGVDFSNAQRLVNSGVNVLVAGNTVFSAADPIKSIDQLKGV
jgi:ribulose-phosphate 3-epimerase